jgi:hypothetical protein
MFVLLSPCFALGVLEGARSASGDSVDEAEAIAGTPDPPERSWVAEDHTTRGYLPESPTALRATHGG